MDIKIDNYRIKSDNMKNVWITEKRKIKDSEGNEKEIETRVAGYSLNFADVLESFLLNKTNGSDATNLIEALEAISNAQSEAIKSARNAAI